MGIDGVVLHPLFLGPFVLVLNTSAYAAEIFYGAIRAVPKGQLEAARAVGMSKSQVFRSTTWPNMLRLAWPAYTNEVVFLFHATALVYFTLRLQRVFTLFSCSLLFSGDIDSYICHLRMGKCQT